MNNLNIELNFMRKYNYLNRSINDIENKLKVIEYEFTKHMDREPKNLSCVHCLKHYKENKNLRKNKMSTNGGKKNKLSGLSSSTNKKLTVSIPPVKNVWKVQNMRNVMNVPCGELYKMYPAIDYKNKKTRKKLIHEICAIRPDCSRTHKSPSFCHKRIRS